MGCVGWGGVCVCVCVCVWGGGGGGGGGGVGWGVGGGVGGWGGGYIRPVWLFDVQGQIKGQDGQLCLVWPVAKWKQQQIISIFGTNDPHLIAYVLWIDWIDLS